MKDYITNEFLTTHDDNPPSLPKAPLKIASAMKGSHREKKMRVKWAPDPDPNPVPTSMSNRQHHNNNNNGKKTSMASYREKKLIVRWAPDLEDPVVSNNNNGKQKGSRGSKGQSRKRGCCLNSEQKDEEPFIDFHLYLLCGCSSFSKLINRGNLAS